jgi:hypothetical protein
VFTKTWRITNSGTCDWPADTMLAFVNGDKLSPTDAVKVGAVKVGQTLDVSVDMQAPNEDEAPVSFWQLKSNGQPFGSQFTTVIIVGNPARRITGNVQWWTTPIPSVRVELKQSMDPSSKVISRTVSGKDGRFVFDNPPAGDHAIFVYSPSKDYLPFSTRQVNVSAAVDIGPVYLYKMMQSLKPDFNSRVSLTPTLSWPNYPGATNYTWGLYESMGNTPFVPQTTISTSVAITQALKSGTQYCWYVVANAGDIPVADGNSCFTARR